ncbi:MAG: TlpA disulfide reductase family protein [Capnocytophaga sp.]|nr:TlpA disulfide reductase family protein [Capnocytophaga sp.]
MKKLFIVALATMGFVACEKKADYVILSGKIEGYIGMPVELVGGTERYTLKVKTDGTFADTLKINTNYYNLLVQQTAFIPLYLQKGDNLGLTISQEKVTFSGKDTIAQAYLRDKNKKLREEQQNIQTLFSGDFENFKKGIANVKKQNDEFLANYKGLPKDFVKLEEKSNMYFDLQLKALYPRVKAGFGEQVTMPEEFQAELDKIDYDNSADFETFETYRNLAADKFFSKYMNEKPDWKAMAEGIRNLKSNNMKKLFAEQLSQGLSPANDDETNTLIYNIVKEYVTNEEYLKEAENSYAAIQKIKVGAPSPKFDYENFNGGKTTLDDLKGKLVYIDVWATWCKPCIDEIPALQALEKEYHGKDVAFVSISIDQEKEKWTEYLKNNKLGGIQLYAELTSDKQNFAQEYSIKSIPRFILIDKNGNIINADAPRPSNPAIKDLLNKNL